MILIILYYSCITHKNMTQATKKLTIFYVLTLICMIAICCYGEDAICCYGTEGGNETCCNDKIYCYSNINVPDSGIVIGCENGTCKDNGPNKDFCDQQYSKCVCGSYDCNEC
jgi:hypothetical protein